MQTKYDSYYEKNIPYKMTLEEMMSQEYIQEEHLLAYIRNTGVENFYFQFTIVNDSMRINKDRIVVDIRETDPIYNPLIERDSLRKNAWYHPYKITLKSLDSKYNDRWYFSDFHSAFTQGYVNIIERKWND